MAQMGCGSRIILALTLTLASAFISYKAEAAGCGNACNCPNRQSCMNGAFLSSCCWSDAVNKCFQVSGSLSTDANNCGACGNQCNTQTSFGRVCAYGKCQCGGVGQPCCQDYHPGGWPGAGYSNSCQAGSGLSSGCNTSAVACDKSCTCKCAAARTFSGALPDFRPNAACP